MSKKVNANANATTTNEVVKPTLAMFMKKYENVSLRRLAIETNGTYGIMLKKSKDPIEGQIYDPLITNWDAVEQYLTKKGIDYATLDWESMNEVVAKKTATLCKDMNEFNVGDEVYLRRNNDVPYQIIYKTETHIVIMLKDTQEPMSWSHNTFILNGPSKTRRNTTNTEEVEA